MNQNKPAVVKKLQERFRNVSVGRGLYIAFVMPTMLSTFSTRAFAADTIWTKASAIMQDVYKQILSNELEDALIWDEQVVELYAAISQLTPIQQRRIRMLMDDMSIREIARQEGCHMNAALKSVNGALKKLRGLLQDH